MQIGEKSIYKIASALAGFEKRQRFAGIERYKLAKANLTALLKRPPSEDELKSVFFYHVLYHIQLLVIPLKKNNRKNILYNTHDYRMLLDNIEKKGAVVISAHLSVPEIPAIIFSKDGVKIHVLIERLKNKFERFFFSFTRQNMGVILQTSAKNIVNEAKYSAGKIFTFLIDRPVPGARRVHIFGEESAMTEFTSSEKNQL